MQHNYVLAGDLGSGGCKTMLIDEEGRVAGSAGAEYLTFYPQPGWVEQDPEDWYRAFAQTTRQVIVQAGVPPCAIKMVGLVGVTHNTMLLDENDRPLRHCILLFQKDYVRHRLAPAYVTDTIDAAGTLLFNPVTEQWIEPFREDLGLSPTALPPATGPMTVVSAVSRAGAQETGLVEGTPVIAGTTDTVAEVFGSGLLQPGQGMVKLASVGRLAVVTERPVSHPDILNYRHVLEGLWYPGSGIKAAATTPRWLRDNLWSVGATAGSGTTARDAPTFAEMDESM